MTTTPDSTPAETEREELAAVLDEADRKIQHGVGWGGYDPDGPPLWLADAAIAAGWSRSPRPATEALCPTCGRTREDRTVGPHAEGYGLCPESFHFRPAARPATISEEAVEVAESAFQKAYTGAVIAAPKMSGGGVTREGARTITATALRAAVTAALPLLTAQPEAEVRADERERVLAGLADAFSGDEYEENAAAASGEGEWSWFKWLATTTIARTAPAHDGSEGADHG